MKVLSSNYIILRVLRTAKTDFLWAKNMDRQVAAEDVEFMRRLDNTECEQYWGNDEKNETVILRSGWDRAKQKYETIKSLKQKKNKATYTFGHLHMV
jgi:hypothetical protein